MKIYGAFPIFKSSFLGGIRIDLLIFTDEAVIYVENARKLASVHSSMISPLSPGVKLLYFGLSGEARRFMEWVQSLRGKSVESGVFEKLKAKVKIIPNREVSHVKVSKGRTIKVEVRSPKTTIRERIAVGLYKEINMDREAVYRQVIEDLSKIDGLKGKITFH